MSKQSYISFTILLIVCVFSLKTTVMAAVPSVNSAETEVLNQAQTEHNRSIESAVNYMQQHTNKHCSPALDFTLAGFLYESGNYSAAAQNYRTALEKMPDFTEAKKNLILCLLANEKNEEACKLTGELLLAREKPSAAILNFAAQSYMAAGKITSAESACRQCLLFYADDNQAQINLIHCLLAQNRCKEALHLIQNSLSENSQQPALWSAAANCALNTGDQAQAAIFLESARRLNAADTEALLLLADIYLNSRQYDLASDIYTTVLEDYAPTNSQLLRCAETLSACGKTTLSQEFISRIINPTEKEKIKLLLLKADNTASDDPQNALLLYRKVLLSSPLELKALKGCADMLSNLRQYPQARHFYNTALSLYPDSPELLVAGARLELVSGNISAGIDLLEKAISIKPDKQLENYIKRLRTMQTQIS